MLMLCIHMGLFCGFSCIAGIHDKHQMSRNKRLKAQKIDDSMSIMHALTKARATRVCKTHTHFFIPHHSSRSPRSGQLGQQTPPQVHWKHSSMSSLTPFRVFKAPVHGSALRQTPLSWHSVFKTCRHWRSHRSVWLQKWESEIRGYNHQRLLRLLRLPKKANPDNNQLCYYIHSTRRLPTYKGI